MVYENKSVAPHVENRIDKDEKKLVNSKANDRTTRSSSVCLSWMRVQGEYIEDINFLTMESLILAQDERWRRASYMQVEREITFG